MFKSKSIINIFLYLFSNIFAILIIVIVLPTFDGPKSVIILFVFSFFILLFFEIISFNSLTSFFISLFELFSSLIIFINFFIFISVFYTTRLIQQKLNIIHTKKGHQRGIQNKKKNRQLAIFAPQYYLRRYDA